MKQIHPDITLDRVMEALNREEHVGFCASCGEETYGVEPDARGYTCEHCDAHAVYGAEEFLFMMA